jgi:hypothetical protein
MSNGKWIRAAFAICLATTALHCGDYAIDPSRTQTESDSLSCLFGLAHWKHQQEWPVSFLVLGTVTYDETELRSILNEPVRGGLVDLAHQVIAAKLNVALGATSPTLTSAIAQADALIGSRVVPPVGAGFLPKTTEPLTISLDMINSGTLGSVRCVSHRLGAAETSGRRRAIRRRAVPSVGVCAECL